MHTRHFILTLAIIAFAMFITAPSWAEITNCTPITALPTVISTQGIYCLTGNLATDISAGIAIMINANNVTLDLNGWKVGGQAAGSATGTTGIYSAANNVTVRNGIVRGFHNGVYLQGRGARIEDLLVDQNTLRGVGVGGQGAVVRRNQVIDTGGSTIASSVEAIGIYVDGPGSVIDDNIISGLTATGESLENALEITSSANQTVVRKNIVSDDTRPTGETHSYGIRAYSAVDVIIDDNNVVNFEYGITYVSGATGTYSQNVVVNCDTPYLGGTVGSDND